MNQDKNLDLLGKNVKRFVKKMKCECGGTFVDSKTDFKGLSVDCMVCRYCGRVSFDTSHIKKIIDLTSLAKKTMKKRKLISVGDSIAVTIPKKFETLGIKIGNEVSIELAGSNAIKIEF